MTNDSATISFAVYDNSAHDFFTNSGITTSKFSGFNTTDATSLNKDAFIYVYAVSNPANPVTDFYVPSANVSDAGTATLTFATTGSSGPTFSTTTGAQVNSAGLHATFNSGNPGDPVAGTAAIKFNYMEIGATSEPTLTNLMIIGASVGPHAGIVQDGDGGEANAIVPVPTPEPGTFALVGLALPLLGWGYARRLRAAKAVAAVQ